MSKSIGIVCEGPTDYIILKALVDQITGEENQYKQLQPEDDLTGEYGNGWKGVWKWCNDHAQILELFMRDVFPQLDLLIVQMDGDVARKEREVHCLCDATICELKGNENPLVCSRLKNGRCPIQLPCMSHDVSVEGYINHLTEVIYSWLGRKREICIVIPCDSTDTWVAAAYDQMANIERIEDPWGNITSKGKSYHGIRIPGHKKRISIYRQFAFKVCSSWGDVKKLCVSAAEFEGSLRKCWML